MWQGEQINPRYRFRTDTILEWLDVTLEEQGTMRTFIGDEERARRRSEHQAERCVRGGLISGDRRRG